MHHLARLYSPRRTAILAAAGVAVLATACGNTNSNGNDAGPSPSPTGALTLPVIPTLPADSQPGPGVSDDAIRIGIDYSVDPDSINHSGGITNADSGPQRDYAQAIIDDINANGGLGGRTLVPVWHAYDAASTAPAEEEDQAMCADYTQDDHVFAALDATGDTLQTCLENAGTVMLDDNVSTSDSQTFVDHPTFVELCCASLDRTANEEYLALNAQDYFSPWNTETGKPGDAPVKVGVLTFDEKQFKGPVDNVLVPQIEAAGYDVETSYASTPESQADLPDIVNDIKAALLKFKTDDVSHVIIFEASGTLGYFFFTDAEQQHYFPRYGTNSSNALQLLIDGKKVGADQLNGNVGFSWTPFSDIPEKENADNGQYSNPTRQRCVSVMKDKGIRFPSQNGEAVALLYCDQLYFLQYAIGRMGDQPINAANWVTTINGIGDGFTSGATFGSHLDQSHHDAMSTVYYIHYDATCNCMQYSGDPVRVP